MIMCNFFPLEISNHSFVHVQAPCSWKYSPNFHSCPHCPKHIKGQWCIIVGKKYFLLSNFISYRFIQHVLAMVD